MQEHIGKKRKKEIREAVELKDAALKYRNRAMIIAGCGIAVALIWMGIVLSHIIPQIYGNTLVNIIPIIIVTVVGVIASRQSRRWGEWNEKYKKQCKKFNITREDVKAYRNGED